MPPSCSPVRTRTRWWAELLTIGWLCWVYDAVNNLAPLRLDARSATGAGSSIWSARWESTPSSRWIAGWPATARWRR